MRREPRVQPLLRLLRRVGTRTHEDLRRPRRRGRDLHGAEHAVAEVADLDRRSGRKRSEVLVEAIDGETLAVEGDEQVLALEPGGRRGGVGLDPVDRRELGAGPRRPPPDVRGGGRGGGGRLRRLVAIGSDF